MSNGHAATIVAQRNFVRTRSGPAQAGPLFANNLRFSDL
jgi:hypothetical protein